MLLTAIASDLAGNLTRGGVDVSVVPGLPTYEDCLPRKINRVERGTNGVFVPENGVRYEGVRFECKIAGATRRGWSLVDFEVVGPPSPGGPGLFGGGTTGDNTLVSCESVTTSGVLLERGVIRPQVPSAFWHGPRGRGYTARRVAIEHAVDGFGVNIAGRSDVLLDQVHVDNLGYFSPCPYQSDGRTHNDPLQIQGGQGARVRWSVLRARCSPDVGNPRGGTNPYYPSATGQAVAVTPNADQVSDLVVEDSELTHGAQSATVTKGRYGIGPGITFRRVRVDTRTNPLITRDGVKSRLAFLVAAGVTVDARDYDGTPAQVKEFV